MHSRLVLLTFLDAGEVDPGFGGGIGAIGGHPGGGPMPGRPGHPSTGPVYPPGHPSAGLPIHGHPGGGPVVPPNVVWPPQFPDRPSNELPPEISTTPGKPTQPIHLPEGQPLPTDAAFVAVYTVNKGWQSAVIKAPPTAGTPPTGAQPK